ncbi:MAG: pyridoxamine 5'-phosphate oxidase family protein [Chitinophagaceae bacterium]
MFGTLLENEIDEVLRNEFIGRIGCHAEGMTYVVPISYAFDGTFIYCHTFEGMKVNMMRRNPMVCFEVDDLYNMANWKSVICFGEFEELPGGQEREKAIKALMNRIVPVVHSETMHLSPQWPFPVNDASEINGIIFRIRLNKKTGRFEKSSTQQFFTS